MSKFNHFTIAAVTACFLLLSATSFAYEGNGMGASSGMKKCMTMSKTGNADEDFIRSMIPHHQMAIDMAQKELNKGKDSEARELAQKIIDAQNEEIKTMQAWLDNNKKQKSQ